MVPRIQSVPAVAFMSATLLKAVSGAHFAPRLALSVEARLALVLAATIAASLYANLSAAPAADATEAHASGS